MLFRQFFDQESCSYSYLLASHPSRQAILIDPVAKQVPIYSQWLRELGLQLTYTVETHTHADHITGGGLLQKQLGSQIVVGAKSAAKHANVRLQDGDHLRWGDCALLALYTPGHTDDCYCYYLPGMLFTGDTLLIRGTGRTDFQSGDAGQAYDSLFNKILCYPDDTLVYPAHNYQGVMVSTIGEEKAHNPRLQVSSRDEYIALMTQLKLTKPKRMDEAVPANLECGINQSLGDL